MPVTAKDPRSLDSVKAAMLEKLQESLLTVRHSKLMCLEPVTEQLAAQLNDIHPAFAGFKIPYFDLAGKVLPFFRYRFLQDKPSRGFASTTVDPVKPLKYTQLAGTAPEVYLSPLLNSGLTWKKVAASTKMPVIITEGELKAACGCVCGMPIIGLGGVWSFQSARLGQRLLPALEAFNWAERTVIICYDSDSNNGTKADVQQAQYRLTMVLTDRGARVKHVDLPPIDGAKVGLDDYIVSQGKDALFKLCDEALDMQYSAELHKMNEEVAYIQSSREIIVLATANIMKAVDFVNIAYKPRKYIEKTGDVSKLHYTAKEWIECPYRNEVARLTYAPGEPMITDVRKDYEYNLWRPSGIIPEPGDVTPWLNMLRRVLPTAKPEHLKWLRQWFAAPLKWPGAKLHSAVLLWGPQGVGKGIIGMTMKRLYGDAFHATSDEILFGRFNYWAHRHSFIMVDEIETKTKFEVSSKLKDIVTRDDISIELKMAAPYTTRDCLNYYFTSNKENAIVIDGDDRRFFIHQAAADKLTDADSAQYFHWLDEEGGSAYLLHYFMHELDMTGFVVKGDPPITDDKKLLVEAGMSKLDQICAHLAEGRQAELKPPQAKLHLFTAEELLTYLMQGREDYDRKFWTANHLSRCLRRAGFKHVANGSNSVVINGVRERVWAICREPKCERLDGAKAGKAYLEERPALKAQIETNEKLEKENTKRLKAGLKPLPAVPSHKYGATIN